jgi:hypothetical protein
LHLTDYVIVQVPRHRWRIIASDDSDIIVPLTFPLLGIPGALLPFFFYLPVLVLLLFLSPLVLVAPICYVTRPYEDDLLVLPESCSVWALFFGGNCYSTESYILIHYVPDGARVSGRPGPALIGGRNFLFPVCGQSSWRKLRYDILARNGDPG